MPAWIALLEIFQKDFVGFKQQVSLKFCRFECRLGRVIYRVRFSKQYHVADVDYLQNKNWIIQLFIQ